MHAFGDALIERLEERWTLKVLVRSDVTPRRRVFAVARARIADLAPYAPIHLGIPIAQLARQGARLTLEGGGLVAPFATRRVVRLGEKSAQLYLYGRHVFARGVRGVQGKPAAGDEVLVLDGYDDRYIGLGIAQVSLGGPPRAPLRGDPDAVVIRNRLDLGLYLRAQQEVP